MALHSQVCPHEQATLKPPATPKLFVPTPISIPMPMPAPKRRHTAVPPPEFDNTPQVVFVSCPTALTSKVAHGPVFHSDHHTTKTTNVAIFTLAPSATVSVSGLMPECTAPTNHIAATSRPDSLPIIPHCAFANTETSLAPAHADGIVPGPIYTSDHPACSISVPAIPSHAFAGAKNLLAATHADRIISTIIPTRTPATTAASSPHHDEHSLTENHKCSFQNFHSDLCSADGPKCHSGLQHHLSCARDGV